jgi:D-3-phosphoglycerate dehydrogenase
MKPGAIFVNTSRGKVVDEQALAAAIESKGLRAGLDVYENQPSPADSASDIPVAHLPGVYGTHHCGASTDQSQEAIAAEAVRIIELYKIEGDAPNVVNLVSKTAATRLLTVRHQNKPGVLAHVIGAVGSAEINIEQMENVIYQGGEAACARIQLDTEPSQGTMQQINDSSKHILSVDLTVIE